MKKKMKQIPQIFLLILLAINFSCLKNSSTSSHKKIQSKNNPESHTTGQSDLTTSLSARGLSATGTSYTTSILPTSSPVILSNDCNLAQDLPVPTHWNESLQKIQAGASDQINIGNPNPEQSSIKYIYNYQFLPKVNNYIGDTYSVHAISNSVAITWIKNLCLKTGQAFRFYRPKNFDGINGIYDIIAHVPQKSGVAIIINGLRNSKSMFAIFLPANWQLPASSSMQKNPYPILFNGFYDLNDNLFRLEGGSMGALIAKSAQGGGTGAIGVLWNGQGAIASRTINPEAWNEFQQIMDLVSKLGGDPHRILGFGESRGGVTPLQMAANPNPHNYTFRYIDSAVPPAHYGTVTKLASPTTPMLLFSMEWTTGIIGSHKKSFLYPDVGNGMKGLDGFSTHLKILTGISNHDLADTGHSLGAESFIKSLKNSGAQIHLELSSHDIIVPSFDPLWLYYQYLSAGIPVELKYNYLAGHYSDLTLRDLRLEKQMQNYTHMRAGNHPKVISGAKTFYKVNPAGQKLELAGIAQFLFTLEVPRFISPEVKGMITITGIPLTEYQLMVKYPDGKTETFSGAINTFGYSNLLFNPEELPIGVYIIESVKIKKPGMIAWKNIAFKNHSFRPSSPMAPLVIENLAFHPTDNGGTISDSIVDGYLENDRSRALGTSFTNVSYGILE